MLKNNNNNNDSRAYRPTLINKKSIKFTKFTKYSYFLLPSYPLLFPLRFEYGMTRPETLFAISTHAQLFVLFFPPFLFPKYYLHHLPSRLERPEDFLGPELTRPICPKPHVEGAASRIRASTPHSYGSSTSSNPPHSATNARHRCYRYSSTSHFGTGIRGRPRTATRRTGSRAGPGERIRTPPRLAREASGRADG